jgi:uncharacterized protein (TIGR02246 family)
MTTTERVMRKIFAALIALMALPGIAGAKPTEITGEHADRDVFAIREVVLNATRGWMEFDVARATSEFADDAYFLNAFGRERKGAPAIKEFIGGVLQSAGYRAGKKTPVELRSIRFLRSNLVIVHTYWETAGQLTQDGTAVGARRSHTFRIMEERRHRWRTNSFIVSDERSTVTVSPSSVR